jgi:hypothetical protein
MRHEMDISQLQDRHHELEAEIDIEAARPVPDDIKIHALKKEKLKIKDEILRLQSVH